jgi:hypothetical protein
LAQERRKYRLRMLWQMVVLMIAGAFLFGFGALFRSHWMGMLSLIAGPALFVGAPIWFGYSVVRSATGGTHDDPEGAVRAFTAEMLSLDPDYARACRTVVPASLDEVSVETVSKAWKQVKEDIRSAVASREKAKCDRCNYEQDGLWSVGKWSISKDAFVQEISIFLRCEKCGAVYCGNCFVHLPTEGLLGRRRNCPSCGEKLKGKPLQLFLTEPEVTCTTPITGVSVAYDEEDDRLANVDVTTRTTSRLKKIVEPSSDYVDKYVSLGERGQVTCHFHNAAVRVGEKWCLLWPLPGEASKERAEVPAES